jgi:hypothetical protein
LTSLGLSRPRRYLLALLDDPAGLLDLGDRGAHLVEVADLLAIDVSVPGALCTKSSSLSVVLERPFAVIKLTHRPSASTEFRILGHFAEAPAQQIGTAD